MPKESVLINEVSSFHGGKMFDLSFLGTFQMCPYLRSVLYIKRDSIIIIISVQFHCDGDGNFKNFFPSLINTDN